MIKIEITGDTAGEVLGSILALAQGMLVGASQPLVQKPTLPAEDELHDPVMPEVRAAAAAAEAEVEKPKRVRRTKEQIAADEAAAAEAAKSAEGNAGVGAGPAEQAQNGLNPSVEDTSASGAKTSPSDGTLDFDKDVAPRVLASVKEKGKPYVLDILSQFGVERASELTPELWPEMLNMLDAA